MPWIQTSDLLPNGTLNGQPLGESEVLQIYCGLDSCLSYEVRQAEEPMLAARPNARRVYRWERALQAPYLEIMQRGFAINQRERDRACVSLRERISNLQEWLDQLGYAFLGRSINPRSHDQLRFLFYEAMRLPERWTSKKGERKLSLDRDTLEHLNDTYLYARPFISTILSIRDLGKQLERFEDEIDSDGRYRASYNIAGTETGRPSSSSNAFGTGGNAQNIAPNLRYVFVADPGWKLCQIDLEQVEARDVGYFCGCLFGDWTYLDACECLTSDHEVLTEVGWLPIGSHPNRIATWANGLIEFRDVLRWNQGIAQNTISVESRSISLQGTLGHEMPVYSHRGNRLERRSLWEIMQKKNLTAPNTGVYVSGIKLVEEAELIAAFQADGTRDKYGRVHWTFTKGRKIAVMQNLLDKLGYRYSIYDLQNSGRVRFYLHAGQGQKSWPKHCGKEVLSWHLTSLEKFCHSHTLWDASIEKNGLIRIYSAVKNHIDWLATAYMLTGRATSINKHKQNYWSLSIRVNNNHQYRSATFTIKDEDSTVHCPTVPSGFFLVRRNDKIFISANSGDLHTINARRIWPDLPWGSDPSQWKTCAGRRFYRDFSYRDMAKRGSHLSNYMGGARTAARALKVPVELIEDFQSRYCRGSSSAYPCISQWWQWTAQQIQTHRMLTTPFGRERHFFGRPNDDNTLREAIAFLPQSTTADRMNLGLWRVWKYVPEVQLLAQTYDSITFQFREESDEDSIVSRCLDLIRVELSRPDGRPYVVPGEAKTGWNWGYYNSDPAKGRINLEGLKTWDGKRPDDRRRSSALGHYLGGKSEPYGAGAA